MQIGEQYNQSCKLQLSNKSQTEHKDVVPTTYIQSNNVWEKNKFKIGKGRSKSSKHQLLLSLQRHHIIVSYNEEQPSLANTLVNQQQTSESPKKLQTIQASLTITPLQ